MPKKLAVTIAGAVSLGSYEAGVLWEVLDAITQHNLSENTAPDDQIIIDVITGASAGGMTAVILAQKLLYSGAEFRSPDDNPLYNTWVKRISLQGLQNTDKSESALQSVFSSDLIATISEEAVMERYQTDPPTAPDRHPAVADKLSIGLALTNLNGLAYTYPVTPGGSFTYIDFSDQMTRRIDAASCDKKGFWEHLRQAAVGCGAFPIAFRAQDIIRSKAIDKDDYTSTNLVWDGAQTTYTYSDGGVLQNQPLGMAKNLVDPIDEHVQSRRYYLFVSPHAKDPTPTLFPASKADYFQMAKRLIGVATGQAGFQDWIVARGVNDRIHKLDTRACELKDVMLQGKLAVTSLQEVATQLLALFFPNGEHCPPGAAKPETLSEAQDRIAKQYQAEIDELKNLPGGQTAFRDAILAFESAAGLGARDLMTIYGITAKDTELAGGGLQSFLGFFDERYRQHDYDLGRSRAREILTAPVLSDAGQIGPLHFTPGAPPAIDHGLDGLQLHKLEPQVKKQFKDGLRRRVNQMLREEHPALVLAEPAADLLLNAIIDHATGE